MEIMLQRAVFTSRAWIAVRSGLELEKVDEGGRLCCISNALMGEGVEDDVDAEGVGVLFGDVGEVPGIALLLLPAVAEVVVEADEHDHAAAVIEDGAEAGCGGVFADLVVHVGAAMLVHLGPVNIAVDLRW